jgi:hypothetical protein
MISGPLEKCPLNLSRVRVAVEGSIGQHMPDDDQDFAGDDGDGFAALCAVPTG